MTSDSIGRSKLDKYFDYAPFSWWKIIIKSLTVIGLFSTIPRMILHFTNPRPSDEDFDRVRAKALKNLQDNRMLNKLGVDESELVQESQFIYGLPPFTEVGDKDLKFRKGNDGKMRFNPIKATAIGFTQERLLSYSCVLDLATGNPAREATDEYFYDDVVSISTETTSYEVKIKGELKEYSDMQTVKLTTSGGTSVEVGLKSQKLMSELGGGVPGAESEQATAAIRKMLREKKVRKTTEGKAKRIAFV